MDIVNLVDSFLGSDLTSIVIVNTTMFSLFLHLVFFCFMFAFLSNRISEKTDFHLQRKGNDKFTNSTIHSFYSLFYSFSKETKKMGFKYTCVVLLLCVIFHSSQAKHLKKDKSTKKGMDLLWVRINRNRSFLSTVFFLFWRGGGEGVRVEIRKCSLSLLILTSTTNP